MTNEDETVVNDNRNFAQMTTNPARSYAEACAATCRDLMKKHDVPRAIQARVLFDEYISALATLKDSSIMSHTEYVETIAVLEESQTFIAGLLEELFATRKIDSDSP